MSASPTTSSRSRPDLAELSIDAWRAYFAYHLLRSSAPTLPEAFENENLRFLEPLSLRRQRAAPAHRALRRHGRSRSSATFSDRSTSNWPSAPTPRQQITQLVDALEKAMAEGHPHACPG